MFKNFPVILSSLLGDKVKIICSVLIFLLVFIFSYWSCPDLLPKISPDGQGYISLSNDLTSKSASFRTFLYPSLIKFYKYCSSDNWKIILSLFQIIFHCTSTVIIFFILDKCKIKLISNIICTLLIGFNPNLIYYSTYILADNTLAFFTNICLYILFRKNILDSKSVILASSFCSLASVTKPAALLLIIVVIFFLLFKRGSSRKTYRIIFFSIVINFSLPLAWEVYNYDNFSKSSMRKTDLILGGINFNAIKGGLVGLGEGTQLYSILEEKQLIETAENLKIELSYTMDEHPDFLTIKKELSNHWEVGVDNEFAFKVIRDAPLKIIFYSLSNWHSFFTKRMWAPSQGAFPGMPVFLKTFYVKFYSYLYRPFLLPLLVFSLFLLVYRKEYDFVIIFFSAIMYASIIIAMLTPQGGEFPRYRVWVEYILWLCALIPLGYGINYILDHTKKLREQIDKFF